MKIVCLGGGPAGLYLAISMKLRDPAHDVAVYERNRPDDTFGWGVVFSDQTVENLRANDPASAEKIVGEFIHWDMIDCFVKGELERSDGHGFIGLGRRRMLEILHQRCRELGVELHFEREFSPEEIDTTFADADVIVAADGLNSKIRNADLDTFACDIDVRPNKFVWLGTNQTFRDAFTFIFEETEHGWIWAHAYQFDETTSTFIVECNPDVYDALGFEHMSQDESAETCRRIFEKYLGGHPLLTNSAHIRGSAWINFPYVLCRNWVKNDRIVLIGDAAHTAHFSIGSGTKLGLEDAISLADHLTTDRSIPEALHAYQAEREIDALRLQNSARNAMIWFENAPRYIRAFDLKQFNYSMLTRSQRVSHENLRLRDREWLEGMEKHLAKRVLGPDFDEAVPPMFLPYTLRETELINRVVVSPMSMYSAVDGLPDDWHLVHYGALAKGGAGLVYTEMTDISPEARITPGCAGLWNDAQEASWKRIVDFVHNHTQAKFALQLGHAGAKGATKEPWNWDPAILDEPLPEDQQWPLVSASAIPYDSYSPVPQAITREQMTQVRQQFVESTLRAARAGFDVLELHAAHGYLISAFITPVLNKRDDEYGGSLENRLRYPLEVFRAMREVWPADRPMSVRISAHDWMGDEGNTEADALAIAQAFSDAGADIIDVSSGQVSHAAKPLPGRMFQTPLSDRIRNEGNIATMAVGNIYEVDHVNSIIAAGRADLVCLARPHLADPNWTLRASAEMGHRGIGVAEQRQYFMGYRQLHVNLQRARENAADQ
ncbi:bifunctional salicylyl-CoA 5-hydroxylase/oxidoreductase [Kineobactrum salinum]|uniref:Bifunctional salicylyl-CoA 5-hydroxylase/oxidoreductase n=1 Tax=Kineobactrum salinum TaxID=2708301 RepID=A0A6C0TXL4_9GAMM|nr:bifunctional salicylyl-CoA 5-hydroxylase/oxidoreductase [Kineobactrum salinum]QIB64516.1 bifunctional salicylyl-CoA 5-hydroxylase/oxidoreductase [Kineobactrum salinum]